jgi:hypothetical protein
MTILKFNHTETEEFRHFLKVDTDYLTNVTTSCGCSTPITKEDGLEVLISAQSMRLVSQALPKELYANKKEYQKNVTITLHYKIAAEDGDIRNNEAWSDKYQIQLTVKEKDKTDEHK